MPKLAAPILLVIAALSVGALASGSRYANLILPGGLPFGNVLAATGLCALTGAAFFLDPPGSARRRTSRIALLASSLWLPFSIALAGNLALNFSDLRGAVWLVITSATAVAALGSLAWSVAGLLIKSRET